MAGMPPPHHDSLALLTDFYELTMAYGYWRAGLQGRRAVFELSFRALPFGGGFAVACGLSAAVDLMEHFRFDATDLDYLAQLPRSDGGPLFESEFLDFLRVLRFSGDVDAMPEGTPVFPHEPLLRIEGPVLECQILETALLNVLNFSTLIATKAARVCHAAAGDAVLEFGLRRAQGIDGGLSASRAAYVGGCHATSNVLAGKRFGIPVRGTHAHSWVMFFGDDRSAFDAFARALPADCIFLVDTYATRTGLRHAVEAGRRLRERGFEMRGVRLDSGDVATLAPEARRVLDAAGFPEAQIVASGDLDEHEIARLKALGTPIAVWGVGTRLATAHDEPALGGVYKLVGLRRDDGSLEPRIKLSDDPGKASLPGAHQVRRYRTEGRCIADAIYDAERGLAAGCTLVDLAEPTRRRRLDDALPFEDLLVPIFRDGKRVVEVASAHAAREHTLQQLGRLPDGVTRLRSPEPYPVGLEASLHQSREQLAAAERRRIEETMG